ncbi:MAG: two-component sensor histidine kinase [Proteobacteria bacterium]|nr:two-component sensor histidine kinase [Pseudomonadota bacterium]
MKAGHFLKLGASTDILIVLFISAVIFGLSGFMELSEKLLILTRPFEAYQLDELPMALFSLFFGMAWFSWKRMRQTLSEMELRLVAQRNLQDVVKENKRLANKYIHLQEEERRLLARELHDELGQGLNAIKIDAVNIREESETDTLVRGSAESIVKVSTDIYQLVRNLTHRLRPVALDELGLSPAIKYLIDSWQKRHSATKCRFVSDGDFEELAENVNITIFRLVQEGLTNVTKHANAKNIEIALHRISNDDSFEFIEVLIKDDGVGIKNKTTKGGLGLVGIRERVEALQGSFQVESGKSNKGTTIKAVVPLR